MASRVMSSWVGPEPAADDDAVAAGQRGPERQHHALVVVADRLVEVGGDAGGGQVLAHPLRVGVGDLPEEQLGADGDDLDAHRLAQAAELVPSTASPRAATVAMPVGVRPGARRGSTAPR